MSEKIAPRWVLDSIGAHLPFFSSHKAPKIKASNGVTFWRTEGKNHWYTTTELSRYTADGTYTPCAVEEDGENNIVKLPPHQQNNINSPTAKGVCAAIDRIYYGYIDTIRPGERESFEALISDPKYYYHYTPKITRLDTALDLPQNVIPAPSDLLEYVRRGRGSGARYIKVAAKQGLYDYKKKADDWNLIRKGDDGKTKAVLTKPYFMRSAKRLRRAILTNEITIYIGTKNGEIKIYAKGGLVRYELSARKSILRKLMPDRRIAALSDPSVLSHLFFAAAERIGELFKRSLRRYGLYLRAVRQAIGSFIRNFVAHNNRAAGYYTRPAARYNNVIIFSPRPLHEQERPPPFLLMTAPISEQ